MAFWPIFFTFLKMREYDVSAPSHPPPFIFLSKNEWGRCQWLAMLLPHWHSSCSRSRSELEWEEPGEG
jgi:hypothetical protein